MAQNVTTSFRSEGSNDTQASFSFQNIHNHQPSFSDLQGSGVLGTASVSGFAFQNSLSQSSTNQSTISQSAINQSFASQSSTYPDHAEDVNTQSDNVIGGSLTNLSNLVCNVTQTSGKEPPALVGASTTIVGDKLYVFGGRRLLRRRTQLTQQMYELDLISRHWKRLETQGTAPSPRYFHSMCALGDTKLVCYGGMAPTTSTERPPTSQNEPAILVMSDIHIFDIATKTWTPIPTADSPPGRYAHCATILPSSGVFTSTNAPLSALQHNPPSNSPNQGSLGVAIDGTGGAEMIIIGGQDHSSCYIEEISIFNLRNLKWTSVSPFNRTCGAYRSVVAPMPASEASRIGTGDLKSDNQYLDEPEGYSALLYSNYNFLDVKLELQVRAPDGTLSEKPMVGGHSPPGLRFPNGAIINGHFVVSGTFLTSSKQEYALWALNLAKMTWSRIDVGGDLFSAGSWNRGVTWTRRNAFVVLGDINRKLAEDYNHRRVNFKHVCLVELEAFGLYDNPRLCEPASDFTSMSATRMLNNNDAATGGRSLFKIARSLGQAAAEIREIADMEIVAIGGERIPVNSHIIGRRWGPYFATLLRTSASSDDDASTIRHGLVGASIRNSNLTITSPSRASLRSDLPSNKSPLLGVDGFPQANGSRVSIVTPTSRPRQLFMPHTNLTIKALVVYLYTSALPKPGHPLCTYQILCSLLQVARPYKIDGLVEAVVERLHEILDGRNTAAVFNAAAMAAGSGDSIAFSEDAALRKERNHMLRHPPRVQSRLNSIESQDASDSEFASSSSMSSSSVTGAEEDDDGGRLWLGGLSVVAGLQKRGLRGLMEGRRLRERVGSDTASTGGVT